MLKEFMLSVGASEDYTKTKWEPDLSAIERQLQQYPSDNARKYAGIAIVLGHIAFADLKISREETKFLQKVMQDDLELKLSEALVITQMATSEELWQGVIIEQVWKVLNASLDKAAKRNLLRTAFQLAVFDGIVPAEMKALTRLASALEITHSEFVEISSNFKQYVQD